MNSVGCVGYVKLYDFMCKRPLCRVGDLIPFYLIFLLRAENLFLLLEVETLTN